MKEQKWDGTVSSAKEFIEATASIGDDEAEERLTVLPVKTRVTELRRRIEERMDSKRIERQFEYDLDHDYDFDKMDEASDHLN